MGKASRTPTSIDKIIDIGITNRKIFGLMRNKTPGGGGVVGISGSGGNFKQTTTQLTGTDLLSSNNVWTGRNIFTGSLFAIEGPVIFIGDDPTDQIFIEGTISDAVNMGNNFIHNVKTPVDCGDAVNKCYLQQVINNLVTANGLADASTIIESLVETVQIGNGTQEYLDIGFIEPRTGLINVPGVISIVETVSIGNGTQEYKDIGFISESITELDPVMSTADLFIQTTNSAHVGDSVGVVSTLPCLTPYFAGQTLTIKINGTTQGTVVAAGDGSFTLTFFVAVGTPLGVGTLTISDGTHTAINAFTVI
jgi:hypothetical protein